jgi:hypothetical protein
METTMARTLGRPLWCAVCAATKGFLQAISAFRFGTNGGHGPVEGGGDLVVIDSAGLREQTAA